MNNISLNRGHLFFLQVKSHKNVGGNKEENLSRVNRPENEAEGARRRS